MKIFLPLFLFLSAYKCIKTCQKKSYSYPLQRNTQLGKFGPEFVRVTPRGITRLKTILNFVRVTPRGVTRLKTILDFVRVTPWGITRLKTILNFVRIKPQGVTREKINFKFCPSYALLNDDVIGGVTRKGRNSKGLTRRA